MKKGWIVSCILGLLLLCGCTEQEAREYTLPEITLPSGYTQISDSEDTVTTETAGKQLDLTLSTNDYIWTDGNYYSKLTLKKDTSIKVKSNGGAIGSLYIIWENDPGRWWLTVDGEDILCGEYGFYHEYIELDVPAETVTIHANAGAVLCDIYAFSQGTVPDWVQIWQPSWDEADLLVIPTHADDEVVFFGGLLPYYAVERDLKVQVVYMTDHTSLEPHRNHELLACMWNMGLRAYPVIGSFNDRLPIFESVAVAKQFMNYDKVLAFQVELLRRFKPSVVVTHDLKGEYGHPAHIVTAQGFTEAVTLAADAANYPESAEKYGTWDTPKLYLHLYGDNETVMDWNKPMEAFDGLTGYEVAALGWAGHRSQHKTNFGVYKDGHVYAGNLFGLYRSTVGEDVVGGDLFENITTYY